MEYFTKYMYEEFINIISNNIISNHAPEVMGYQILISIALALVQLQDIYLCRL